MPAGPLLAAYAYQVAPRQESPIVGGAIKPTPHLEAALDAVFSRSKIQTAPVVSLLVNTVPGSRDHPVRDAVREIAFAADPKVARVEDMAARLSGAMDNRSKPALFVVSAHEASTAGTKRILLWTFPRQDVFNLQAEDGTVSLELLQAFNRESNLRKAALFEGRDLKNSMLTARVLDFQAATIDRAVADLWITKFLGARVQVSRAEGTRMVATALRSAYTKACDDPNSQDQIIAAISGLRVTPLPTWTMESVAETYLSGFARDAFLDNVPPESLRSPFGIDTEKFDATVQFARYVLANGVVVSAPFGEISDDGGVQISTGDGRRMLRAHGEIRDAKVTSRA